jgi:hypothetical protein
VTQPVIEVHVGEDAPSDVLEATLLREAMAMASERFLDLGLRCCPLDLRRLLAQ